MNPQASQAAMQSPQAAIQTFDRQPVTPKPAGTTVEGMAMDSLTSHVRRCFEMALTAKTIITTRLLQCERQRRGEYDPDHKIKIAQTGGSDIFMMLTDIKCRAAEAWMKDVLMNAQDKPWGLDPTPIPDLPEHMRQDVIEHVVQEAMAVQQQMGQPVDPEAISVRMDEVYKEVNDALNKKAKTAAKRMEDKIEDILAEAKFDYTYGEVIHDFVTYPSAILKGPTVRKRKGLSWGPNFTPQVTMNTGRDFYRVSPYDIFPAPNATGVDDEFIIERLRLSRRDLQSMIGTPGNNDDAIKAALDLYGRNGLRNWRMGDFEHDWLEGKYHTFATDGLIECMEFWGSISGKSLLEWGMKDVDPYQDYEANVWVVGPHTIRCVLNADPLGRRPYEISSFVRIPGAFWGVALPELMRDVQIMCNAAARALANNMAIASGPMVEVTVDRLPVGEKVSQIHPWKVFQTTSDKSGGGQPAIRFFQPNMNAETLMSVYQYFQRVADEVTGVPNYIYGSGQASGAGRTASGLSMLMENAAKGIKHAILSLDKSMSCMLQRLFEHLMIYDPDQSIKGDMKIIPRGVVATIIKDNVQMRRQEFLQATANPFDIQVMGMKGRAALLRETAKGLDMPIDDVVPNPENIEQLIAQMQQQQMQQQMQQQQMAAQQGAPQGPQQRPPQQAPQQGQPMPA